MPPVIELAGITIMKPMAILTNGLVAILCIIFYISLRKHSFNPALSHWHHFFLWIGIATLVGGIGHGLEAYDPQKIISRFAWMCSGLALFAAERSAISLVKSPTLAKRLVVFIQAQLILYLFIVLFTKYFAIVEINSAIGMVGIVLSILGVDYWKFKTRSSLRIILGILSLATVPIVKGLCLGMGSLFDRHDISHFIMLITFSLIFSGVLMKIREREGNQSS